MTATWSVDHAEAQWCVPVVGEFDLADEDVFVDDVLTQIRGSDDPVLLDFAGLDFMDSSGIRAILRLHQRHFEHVVVVAASDAVVKVLEIAGVQRMLAGRAVMADADGA